MPGATARAYDLAFASTFLEELQPRVGNGLFSDDIASIAIQSVLQAVTPSFVQSTWGHSPKRQKLNPQDILPRDDQHMVYIIGISISSRHLEDSSRLIQTITNVLPTTDSRWLQNILIPFLEELSIILSQYRLLCTKYQALFRDGLTYIISRYIGQPPANPVDWTLRS